MVILAVHVVIEIMQRELAIDDPGVSVMLQQHALHDVVWRLGNHGPPSPKEHPNKKRRMNASSRPDQTYDIT